MLSHAAIIFNALHEFQELTGNFPQIIIISGMCSKNMNLFLSVWPLQMAEVLF